MVRKELGFPRQGFLPELWKGEFLQWSPMALQECALFTSYSGFKMHYILQVFYILVIKNISSLLVLYFQVVSYVTPVNKHLRLHFIFPQTFEIQHICNRMGFIFVFQACLSSCIS